MKIVVVSKLPVDFIILGNTIFIKPKMIGKFIKI